MHWVSWCPDVILFYLRHLDAYNEMVVCVIKSEWQAYAIDVCSLRRLIGLIECKRERSRALRQGVAK